ncbi:PilZ domain-containing protein [Croceibacterium ferulae]|uniref:PilZ domain-containing protein n=1 Tax=Croceibacterium ferulae TaxID=1854641 RepID=UPI000EB51953|nr:PilZ domain-containing protein [Croceibacterium ferulae]
MPSGAQLSILDLRGAVRHRVDFRVRGEHLRNDIQTVFRVRDLSLKGVLIDPAPVLKLGERLSLLLPSVGRIETHCIWSAGGLAGFQFERILRPDELAAMSEAMHLNLPSRKRAGRSAKIAACA